MNNMIEPMAYPATPGQPAYNQQGGSDISQPGMYNPNAAAAPMIPEGFAPQIQGYGNVGGFGQPMSPMPPPPPMAPPSGPPPAMEFQNVTTLTEAECQEAMLEFVGQHCCYGKDAARYHVIENIQPSTALHYSLETFCESRSTGYVTEPFNGQPIDGPQNGTAPLPWQIPCVPDEMFRNHTKELEVPHTAVVKLCHYCKGLGYNTCYHCDGIGRRQCSICDGRGVRMVYREGNQIRESCYSCGGDGRCTCYSCGGDGRLTCSTCNGFCELKCSIRLSVTFQNHLEEYILEETDMPDELIKNVEGDVIFEQQLFQVWPIAHYPVTKVAENSVRLVDSHRTKFPNERALQQRQRLRAVPVTEVDVQWKQWKSRYWVYGHEKIVHCPDYPQKCCWGCNIL